MVDCLIFSKDRPMQFDLLVRSIDRFAAGIFRKGLMNASDLSEKVHGFEHGVRSWLAKAGEQVSFLVDDDVFIRPASRPGRLPFAYRMSGGPYKWRDLEGDEGYPMSLDGTVFDKQTLLPLLDFHFDNPTQLEAGLADRARQGFKPEYLYASRQALVGIPANVVSESSGNPHMGVDPAELTARYERGERIDLDAIVAWCEAQPELFAHMEVPFTYSKSAI